MAYAAKSIASMRYPCHEHDSPLGFCVVLILGVLLLCGPRLCISAAKAFIAPLKAAAYHSCPVLPGHQHTSVQSGGRRERDAAIERALGEHLVLSSAQNLLIMDLHQAGSDHTAGTPGDADLTRTCLSYLALRSWGEPEVLEELYLSHETWHMRGACHSPPSARSTLTVWFHPGISDAISFSSTSPHACCTYRELG